MTLLNKTGMRTAAFRAPHQVLLHDRAEEHPGQHSQGHYALPGELHQGQLAERAGQSTVQARGDRVSPGGVGTHRCSQERGFRNVAGTVIFCLSNCLISSPCA